MVEDSAGRRVEVPDRVERVFAAGPPAAILLYVLKPEALLGWPRPLQADERPYIAPLARDLPETGRLTGRGGEANLEVVLKLQPDLIVDFGSVRDTYVSLAQRGYGIVLSTHDPDHAFACASRVAVLHAGRLVAQGAPGDVLSAELLRQVYDVEVVIERLPGGQTVCAPDLRLP